MLNAMVGAAWVAIAAAGPVKLAAPGLSGAGLPPEKVQFFSEHLAQAMSSDALRVVTQREIGALLGMERQKALLGCGDEAASCMAELGAALGAAGIVLGDLARIGDKTQVNLKVISTTDSSVLARGSARASNEEELTDELSRLGRELASEVLVKLGGAAPRVSTAAPNRLRPAAWGPVAAGVVIGAVGAGLLIASSAAANQLRTGTMTYEQGVALRNTGATEQLLGLVGVALGAAAVVAGVVVFAIGPSAPRASVSFFAAPGGGAVAVQGSWP